MSKNFWDKIAGSYDINTNKIYKFANRKVIKLTRKYVKPDTILLDVGCGTGMLTIELAKHVKHVDAIDSSAEMLKIAKEKTRQSEITNISFENKRINNKKSIDSKYDIITAFNLLLYLEYPEQLISNIYNNLTDGGYFISVTDCMGEKVNLIKKIQILLSKWGILPYFQTFKTADLIHLIEKSGFEIEYTENVHTTPPNYFIAARKK